MSREMKRYLKDVKLLLPIFGKEEKDYYKQLEQDLHKQFSNSSVSYDEIIEEIGEPYDVVSAYVDEIDSSDLIHKMRMQNFIKKIVAIITTIIVVSIVCISLWKMYSINQIKNEFYESIPVEIEENVEMIE